MGSKVLKTLVPIAATIAGNAILPGIGGAIGSGIGTKVTGGSWGDALKSGAFSYAGGKIGGAIGNSDIGKSLGLGGTVGDAAGFTSNAFKTQAGTMGADFGDIAANSITSAPLASTLGAYAGNSMASPAPKISGPQGPTPFSPTQQAAQALPGSMSAFGSLTPEQQSSNIATQGVYGGGAGPSEQSYFMNLMNRRLVDGQGKVDENMSDISPIENSYLSQLGLGGYGNTKSLLEAMSKWSPR